MLNEIIIYKCIFQVVPSLLLFMRINVLNVNFINIRYLRNRMLFNV